MSTAKIKIAGTDKGTAWLIHEQHVVTAAHCVGATGTAVELHFWESGTNTFLAAIPAEVVQRNVQLDVALLRLDVPHPEIPVLSVSKRSAAESQANWRGAGFPAAGAGLVAIFGVHGTVALMRNALNRQGTFVGAIQLTCPQGLERYPARAMVDADGVPVHFLAGISGAAIIIPEKANRVIGIVRCAMEAFGPATIFASPIDEVWEELRPHLPGTVLHEWQRNSGCVRFDGGAVISNMDRELVEAAWADDTVKDITVDIAWSDVGPLVPAVLRLVLHQPGIVRLHVRNAAAWNERLRRYADSWIALHEFNPSERPGPAREITVGSLDAGASFPTVGLAATALHQFCDTFALEQLDRGLGTLFEAQRPEDYAGYLIAADVLAQMVTTWTEWRASLRADAVLLHHFLALMLTHQGGHDCTNDPSPGAGPLTFKACLLPATIFGLALAPCLPTTLNPKHPSPGNLGRDAVNGHTCGIQAIQRRPLDTELRGHAWTTQVVLLQMLQHRPAEWDAAGESLLSNGRDRPTLNRVAPSSLVITRDIEIRAAIATSVVAIRQILQTRYNGLIQQQQAYAAAAAPPA